MGKLTTHVLDTAHGRPAAGLVLALLRFEPGQLEGSGRLLASAVTNADGRLDAPLLQGEFFAAGLYALVFHTGDYFAAQGVVLPEPAFFDRVTVHFGIADAGQNYHVPLLVSPYGYSTYRGS